jgi:hypothetical protein
MFNFDPNDPRQAGLMQMALSLMASKGNLGQAIGQAGQQGLMGYQGAQQNKMRSAEEEQQRQMRQMQMDQMKQQQAEQQQMRSLAQSAFGPNPNLVSGDDQGNPMPQAPGGGGMPEFYKGLMQVNPMLAVQMAPKPKMAFAPNGQAVDMNNLQPGNYAPPEKTPDWQNPAYQKFMLEKAKAGSSRVTVDTRQENEFNKKMGANYAEEYTGILKAGAASGGELQELQRFESIITKVPTGKLEPLKAEVTKLASSLGFEVDTKKLGFQEALEALSNKFALTLRNPAGGAGMPGALSDKDRIFLVSMVPGLAKTPAGNRIIVEAFKRAAQRKSEAAQLARDYVTRKGTFDAGYYQELEKLAAKDIMSDLREQAAQLGGGGGNNDPLGLR